MSEGSGSLASLLLLTFILVHTLTLTLPEKHFHPLVSLTHFCYSAVVTTFSRYVRPSVPYNCWRHYSHELNYN